MGTIFYILFWILQIYQFIILVRVLLSWIPNIDYNNPVVKFLYDITEPVLAPIRRALPPMSGVDLSPIIVFLGISVLQMLLR